MNKGFSLLETIVALTVLVIALTGSLTLASQSIRSASIAKNQAVASYLAEEAMEYIRNRRDTNIISGLAWDNGLGPCKRRNGCYVDVPSDKIKRCRFSCPLIKYDSTTGLYRYDVGDETIFKRIVKIKRVPGTDDEIKIKVIVSWREIFGDFSFNTQEHLFKWQ